MDPPTKCLGIADEYKIGIVVNVSDKEPMGNVHSVDKKAYTVRVMSLHDGSLLEYASTDLQYADGSKAGQINSAIANSRPILDASKAQGN